MIVSIILRKIGCVASFFLFYYSFRFFKFLLFTNEIYIEKKKDKDPTKSI